VSDVFTSGSDILNIQYKMLELLTHKRLIQ